MKNSVEISAFFRISLLAVLFGVSTFSKTSYSQNLEASIGANCHAIVPRQSELMEWRWYGLVNKDPKRPLWMICPATMPEPVFATSDFFYRGVYVSSAISGEEITCMLRYMDWATERIMSVSRTAFTGPVLNPLYRGLKYEGSMEWEIPNNVSSGLPSSLLVSISCLMPPNSAIVTVLKGP